MVATTNFQQLASLIAAHCDQPFSAVMACRGGSREGARGAGAPPFKHFLYLPYAT